MFQIPRQSSLLEAPVSRVRSSVSTKTFVKWSEASLTMTQVQQWKESWRVVIIQTFIKHLIFLVEILLIWEARTGGVSYNLSQQEHLLLHRKFSSVFNFKHCLDQKLIEQISCKLVRYPTSHVSAPAQLKTQWSTVSMLIKQYYNILWQ